MIDTDTLAASLSTSLPEASAVPAYPVAFPGRFASLKTAHSTHVGRSRIIAETLTGPLKALVSCADCSWTATVTPNEKYRKLRPGFTDATWADFVARGRLRRAQ